MDIMCTLFVGCVALRRAVFLCQRMVCLLRTGRHGYICDTAANIVHSTSGKMMHHVHQAASLNGCNIPYIGSGHTYGTLQK